MITSFHCHLRSTVCGLSFLFLLATGAVAQGHKVDFEKQIWPFMKASCVDCHRAPYTKNGKLKKPKAGLRLDAAWAISQGSEDGAVVDAGKGDESSLYTAVMLPAADDDVMPPEGKADALTAKQKELLKRWIDEGADFGSWIGNLEGKPMIAANSGAKLPVSEIQEFYKKMAEGLEELEEEQWRGITEKGGRVIPLADESPLLAVDFRHSNREFDSISLNGLSALGKNVVQVDLSNTKVSDGDLPSLAKLENLVRLDLHETQVGDDGLKGLVDVKNLRYLNLYGTQVSDKGLQGLAKMQSLRELYLWRSKVTVKGVKQLQKKLPNTKISWK